MVYQRCLMGLSYAEVGRRLNVHPTTGVERSSYLRKQELFVVFKGSYHENTHKKLSSRDELAIIEAVLDNPSMYLYDEMQNVVLQTTGTEITPSAICKFLHKQGFSRRKLTYIALQRSEELRSQFFS